MGLQVFEPYKCDVRHKVFGSFKVQAFTVPHGDCLCFGFYIKVVDHKLIYATDFEYIPFNFHKQALDTLIVECNYQDEYVDRDAPNFDHKILDHCELQTTIGVIKANQTDYLKNVIITHMGESTANAIECVTEIKRVTKEWVNVDYARPGATYILSK